MHSRNDEAPTARTVRASNLPVNPSEKTSMNIVAKSDLNFHGKALIPVSNITGTWLTSSDLAKALEYSNSRAVTMIYNKYADEFTSGMSQVLEVSTTGNYRKKVRVFSLRGAHLIAMFARTPVAKEFRRWVLDILDRETGDQVELSPLYRYTTTVTIKDNLFGGEVAFMGKSNDFNNMATGICETLGFKPLGFSAVKPSFETMKRIH